MATRLVLDAAALSHALPELRAASSLADLGSGAGFPGIPIAILNPHLAVTLVDSRLKRNHFQRAVRRELDLARITPVLGRSDQVEIHPAEIVVAQAMAQPAAALKLMRPWASRGGLLVLPASESAERPELPGADIQIEERSYRVPESDVRRKLWLIRADSV
jgi:16S rRNA (guanine527-N7)-methyltransferase